MLKWERCSYIVDKNVIYELKASKLAFTWKEFCKVKKKKVPIGEST